MPFKIALVGEAWGEEEAQWKRPFIGPSGQELDRMLADAGILREECYATNVFNLHPERNDLQTMCVGARDPERLLGVDPLIKGKYLRKEYAGEVTRVLGELASIRPNVTVLLGNTACWAILNETSISKIRGTARISSVTGGKCIPAYHPSAVLRQYELRHVTVLDLAKAKRESEFPELRRPSREIWIEPTLEDVARFFELYLKEANEIAFDIETANEQITCIGFAPTVGLALVIPFVDPRKKSGSYWPTKEEELRAWDWVVRILDLPCAKSGQNTLYDIQYLWMKYGIPVRNYSDDTMLLHHALQPESNKGLAFLGSVYTNETAWKADRPRAGDETIKRED